MAERKRSKESKGIDGEEGTGPTDGSKQKGGGGEKDNQMQKRVRLGGAAHYVHKRVKGQPKSTLKKKEGKSSFPPSLAQETWSPTPWQNTTQPLAVISSVETLSSTEGATPPTALKYDDHDVSSFLPESVIPQQSSDDVELSLKLARIELENVRYKREYQNKERQIKEYEEEIIKLRTQMSRSGGGGGGSVKVVVDQSATQKLTRTIYQLEKEKEELMKEKEELMKSKEGLEQKLTVANEELKKEKVELLAINKELEDGMERERELLRNEIKNKVAEEKAKMELEKNQLKEELMREKEALKDELKEKEEELKIQKEELTKEKEKQIDKKEELIKTLTKEKDKLMKEKEPLARELEEKRAEEEELMRENRALKKEFEEEKGKLVKEDEDRIISLVQLLEKEMEERSKGEEHKTELEEKHAIELEGIKQQLDAVRAEKNRLKMNYQQKYEAQLKQYEEEMDEKMKQLHEETAAVIKQKETKAKALQDREEEAVLKEVEDLRNEVKMRKEDIKTLEAQVVEAGNAYKKLEAQLIKQEEEIEACVNERLREEVDKHLREAVKAQLSSQKIDEQKKVFAAHVKGKEEKVKTQYEVLLASKERRIKELGAEVEEIMEQLKWKKETEHYLREEIINLQLKVKRYEAQIKELEEEMNEKMKLVQEETAAKIKQHIEATAKAQDREEESVLKEVEDLKIEVKMRREDIETLEAQVAEAVDAYKKLEAQLMIQEEEIEARVNEILRKEVDKHLREAVKAQLTSQKTDEQKKVFAAHQKEKEEKVKIQYEVLLASKERRIKELGAEVEEIMEQLKWKKETEHYLREEIINLQLKVDALDGVSANNSLSEEDKMRRELEDQAARVQDLEEMIGIVEKNKREVEQHLAVEIKDKDEEIQKLQGQVQNNALLSAELRKLLEKNEKQLADLKKNVEELEDVLNNKVAEIEDLTDALTEKEREIIRLTEVLAEEKKQTVRQLKRQLDELLKKIKTQERQMKDLVEKIQLKEAENAFYKQDFESERTDRQRIHAKYEELKIKTEEERLQHKADKDAMANLTEELQKHEEWIQVLTAQVNAYSREVDRQKGLVTQSQEKHKTEVNELVERLASGTKSKEQLDNELTRMRQQLDNVSADKEELLRAYHQERAKLEDQIDKLKKANIVLKDKLLASIKSPSELSRLHEVERQLSSKQEEVISLQKILSGFQNTWELSHREVSLLEELGRGGYGVVWVGQLKVAVKKLHERIVSQHNMETFHHEINIMSQLRHPNLLQFIGAVLDHPSSCPMIVTEVMDTSLREAYERGELTCDPGCRPVILSIMLDAAVGLNYLHCLPDPIIHRDVSSANVLLQSIAGARKWKGKISDFGSAKLAKKAITEGPGAFAYSAPEAFQSIASHDPTKKQTTKMDVFSYGVLLCEIITCRFPNRDIFRGMLRQVHSISNRPSGTRDTQGSLLHSLIVSCCHDDPSRRPTMKEIIEQLDIISK